MALAAGQLRTQLGWLPVYTYGRLFVAGQWVIAGAVMEATVLSSGMRSSTPATMLLSGTLCRSVPPAMAPETLLWMGDINVNAAGDTPYGKVKINGSFGGSFHLQTDHQGAPPCFLMDGRTVEPHHVGDGKI